MVNNLIYFVKDALGSANIMDEIKKKLVNSLMNHGLDFQIRSGAIIKN